MIGIRVLTEADWPLWRELRLAALADAPGAFGSTLADWRDAGEQRWRERLRVGRNLVADLDGHPAGMATGVPQGAAVELISMWVAPAGRGRGVGDALIGAVLDQARAAGADLATLRVVEGNRAATALYERHGFVDDGRVPGDGAVVERRMRRRP